MKENVCIGAKEKMRTPLTPEVAAAKALADEVIAAASDPDRAMVAFVKTWLLGAVIADDARADVLDDLVGLAVEVALRSGVELSLLAALEEWGEHERVQRIRDAVEAGRARHLEVSARAIRLYDLQRIREGHLV